MLKTLYQFPLASFISGMVIELPSPSSLTVWWNLGSLLGMLMVIQVISGWFLTFFYVNDMSLSFTSVWLLHLESWNGSLLHWIHMNTASFIFLVVYGHFLKGLHFQSWKTNKFVWGSGLVILILLMGAAFLGYVLPFGQMSLWGATVITNLLSVISVKLVIWIWGGYSVNALTLNLFFTLHYLLPLIILVMAGVHLWLLHFNGSTHFSYKVQFWPGYVWKDSWNMIIIIMMLWWSLIFTYMSADVENFMFANPSVSPLHIKPEWYFLTYYAILRSIPNKVLGVMMFALSLFIYFILMFNSSNELDFFSPFWSAWVSSFVVINIILLLIGGAPVETPYLELGQVFTVLYFSWFGPCIFNFFE